MTNYRGRIAPSPTGYLHIGHAMTFWRAQERARAAGGSLILRIEDLDLARFRSEFHDAIIADLKWFGLEWNEGPDQAGPFAPYVQSERRAIYLDAWEKLRARGFIYPCQCSRKDVFEAAVAPHDENEEPIYPGTCRPVESAVSASRTDSSGGEPAEKTADVPPARRPRHPGPAGVHWRFRVPDGEEMRYVDLRLGEQHVIAGKDFGDFIVWRKDDVPAYQLAVVVDDAAMKISEVVRGEDLLRSTFRQLLMYRALNLSAPEFYHAPLTVDESGRRLAKRHASLSLRALRESGADPEELRKRFLCSGALPGAP
jgi:glutamyl/glutaminyl-tRNA synthetase